MSGSFFLFFSFNNWKEEERSYIQENKNIRDHHHLLLYSRTAPLGWSCGSFYVDIAHHAIYSLGQSPFK
jgi:hypothetical protein